MIRCIVKCRTKWLQFVLHEAVQRNERAWQPDIILLDSDGVFGAHDAVVVLV